MGLHTFIVFWLKENIWNNVGRYYSQILDVLQCFFCILGWHVNPNKYQRTPVGHRPSYHWFWPTFNVLSDPVTSFASSYVITNIHYHGNTTASKTPTRKSRANRDTERIICNIDTYSLSLVFDPIVHIDELWEILKSMYLIYLLHTSILANDRFKSLNKITEVE